MKNDPFYVVVPVENGTGGRKKYNSIDEALDAARQLTRDYGRAQVVYKAVAISQRAEPPVEVYILA